MTPTIPVTPHFVTELVHRMRSSNLSWAAALNELRATRASTADDCSDVEFAPAYGNGAGPFVAPLLPVRS